MKAGNSYLKFVCWNEQDGLYIGYCPDLFPCGGVYHAATAEEAYRELCSLVRDEIEELHVPATRRNRLNFQAVLPGLEFEDETDFLLA